MSLEKNKNATELFQRIDIPNSPFQVIYMKDTEICFGVFGKYKITKDFKTVEQVLEQFETITWDKIVIVCSLIHELLKDPLLKDPLYKPNATKKPK